MSGKEATSDPIVPVVSALRTRTGLVVVVSAPSGAGKTTVCERLVTEMPELAISVSYTTRRPRKGEKNGEDYFFVSVEEFGEKLDQGLFLEWAEVHDHFYGTPRDFLERRVRTGKDTVLDIDVQGAYSVSRAFPKAVLIQLLPPSLAELERRLRGRDPGTGIKRRLQKAEHEFYCYPMFDYLVVNENVDEAVEQLKAIVKAERCRAERLNSRPSRTGQ